MLSIAAAFALSCAAWAQAAPAPATPLHDQDPVVLDWTPPALAALSSQATVKNNFTFDRGMLQTAASFISQDDEPTRQAINHLDGISVHLLRFGQNGIPDENAVDRIRDSYHLRGWKHIVTTTRAGGPVRSGTTDVWVMMDGAILRGAVILAETPRSLTLVTVVGNLSPADLLHLRGRFGIPQFESDGLRSAK
ncbi:MAG: hypothetical protein WCF17_02280 [Terracidiphilus sp.]